MMKEKRRKMFSLRKKKGGEEGEQLSPKKESRRKGGEEGEQISPRKESRRISTTSPKPFETGSPRKSRMNRVGSAGTLNTVPLLDGSISSSSTRRSSAINTASARRIDVPNEKKVNWYPFFVSVVHPGATDYYEYASKEDLWWSREFLERRMDEQYESDDDERNHTHRMLVEGKDIKPTVRRGGRRPKPPPAFQPQLQPLKSCLRSNINNNAREKRNLQWYPGDVVGEIGRPDGYFDGVMREHLWWSEEDMEEMRFRESQNFFLGQLTFLPRHDGERKLLAEMVRKLNGAIEQAQKTTEKPQLKAEKPQMTAEEPQLKAEKPQMTAEKPQMTAEKPQERLKRNIRWYPGDVAGQLGRPENFFDNVEPGDIWWNVKELSDFLNRENNSDGNVAFNQNQNRVDLPELAQLPALPDQESSDNSQVAEETKEAEVEQQVNALGGNLVTTDHDGSRKEEEISQVRPVPDLPEEEQLPIELIDEQLSSDDESKEYGYNLHHSKGLSENFNKLNINEEALEMEMPRGELFPSSTQASLEQTLTEALEMETPTGELFPVSTQASLEQTSTEALETEMPKGELFPSSTHASLEQTLTETLEMEIPTGELFPVSTQTSLKQTSTDALEMDMPTGELFPVSHLALSTATDDIEIFVSTTDTSSLDVESQRLVTEVGQDTYYDIGREHQPHQNCRLNNFSDATDSHVAIEDHNGFDETFDDYRNGVTSNDMQTNVQHLSYQQGWTGIGNYRVFNQGNNYPYDTNPGQDFESRQLRQTGITNSVNPDIGLVNNLNTMGGASRNVQQQRLQDGTQPENILESRRFQSKNEIGPNQFSTDPTWQQHGFAVAGSSHPYQEEFSRRFSLPSSQTQADPNIIQNRDVRIATTHQSAINSNIMLQEGSHGEGDSWQAYQGKRASHDFSSTVYGGGMQQPHPDDRSVRDRLGGAIVTNIMANNQRLQQHISGMMDSSQMFLENDSSLGSSSLSQSIDNNLRNEFGTANLAMPDNTLLRGAYDKHGRNLTAGHNMTHVNHSVYSDDMEISSNVHEVKHSKGLQKIDLRSANSYQQPPIDIPETRREPEGLNYPTGIFNGSIAQGFSGENPGDLRHSIRPPDQYSYPDPFRGQHVNDDATVSTDMHSRSSAFPGTRPDPALYVSQSFQMGKPYPTSTVGRLPGQYPDNMGIGPGFRPSDQSVASVRSRARILAHPLDRRFWYPPTNKLVSILKGSVNAKNWQRTGIKKHVRWIQGEVTISTVATYMEFANPFDIWWSRQELQARRQADDHELQSMESARVFDQECDLIYDKLMHEVKILFDRRRNQDPSEEFLWNSNKLQQLLTPNLLQGVMNGHRGLEMGGLAGRRERTGEVVDIVFDHIESEIQRLQKQRRMNRRGEALSKATAEATLCDRLFAHIMGLADQIVES